MKSKHLFLTMGGSLLLIGSAVLAQTLKPRVLVERDSLKVTGSETFPHDLSCEIFVGPRRYPHFSTEGKSNLLKTLAIDVNLATTVSVVRKETENEAYVLYLFSEDDEGKVFGLFDLNLDGEWDVKKQSTRRRNSILVNKTWVEVERIDGLLSSTPTAVSDKGRYVFRQAWVSAPQ